MTDLSAHTDEQLDDLATELFNELVKRKRQAHILNRFTTPVLKQLGESILDVFAVRYSEMNSRDKQTMSQELIDFVEGIFPGFTHAHELNIQFASHGTQLLQLLANRNRKSDPKIIMRNVEICDLRQRDSKTWTQGKLAKQYGIKPSTIREILKQEIKWREKLLKLSGN